LSMDGGAIPEEAGFLNKLAHDLAPDSTTTGSSGISTAAAGGAISGDVTTAATTGSSLGGGGVGTEGCGGDAGSGAIITSS